jgi:hypothetical protein
VEVAADPYTLLLKPQNVEAPDESGIDRNPQTRYRDHATIYTATTEVAIPKLLPGAPAVEASRTGYTEIDPPMRAIDEMDAI